ncbi:MAG: hypothetical protein UT50_C0008G0015 [Candidatus Moranbacteria bacterium GW2011_GWA2_39_41]|nr:MAG: hypothetical protein UT50_C0008G0015 [Candidatus Moranbacteria bacterium GW2011_GWA2_39_41]
MTNNSPCGCDHDHEEPAYAKATSDAPMAEQATAEHECCGGECHGCGDDDNSEEDSCGCGHDHGHDMPAITPEEMEKLKAAIIEAGYKIEETPEGELKILEK